VDVTAHAPSDATSALPAKSPSDEQRSVQQGHEAAGLIASALNNMGWAARSPPAPPPGPLPDLLPAPLPGAARPAALGPVFACTPAWRRAPRRCAALR
jgi:hypothetical protein